MNGYIGCAIDLALAERTNGGYNIHRIYTQDLSYAPGGKPIPARRRSGGAYGPPYDPNGINPSMCVAAISEILIEAINFYAAANGAEVYDTIPRTKWLPATPSSFTANIFRYKGSGVSGTADAAAKLGFGRKKPFNELRKYDVVNFERKYRSGKWGGHAAFFINYITPDGPTSEFSADVIGFRYFSIQGRGRPDAGFGYRNAYFWYEARDGAPERSFCPSPRGPEDDCRLISPIIRADGSILQNQRSFNTGEITSPILWKETVPAQYQKLLEATSRDRGIRRTARRRGVSPESLARAALNTPLRDDDFDLNLFEDGSAEE